jgi:hypothetical protein
MPRAKSEAKREPEPADTGEVIAAEPVAEPEAEPKEPGWHVSDSMKRLLIEAARVVGLNADDLLAQWPRIDPGNFNAIRQELKAMAEAEAQ